MKNFRNSGQEVTWTADADHKSGDLVKIGRMYGVCAMDVKAGAQVSCDVEGAFELKKKDATVVDQGALVYAGANGADVTGTDPVGIATKASIANAKVVEVKLIPGIKA